MFIKLKLIEAVSGRLIGPKSWNRNVGIMRPIWTVRKSLGTVLGICVVICDTNCVLCA